MNMETFKAEYLKEEDTVTVSARELQNLLIKYDSLQRQVDKKQKVIDNMMGINERLNEKLEECENTHITLDLKV